MFDWPLTPPKQVTLLLSLILAISACSGSLASYRRAAAGLRLCSLSFRLRSASCGKRVSRHLADAR